MPDSFPAKTIGFGEAASYRIAVQGRVSSETAARLGGMQVTTEDPTSGVTVLVGRLCDQAELSGVLNTLHDLHLLILEVKALENEESAGNSGLTTERPSGH